MPAEWEPHQATWVSWPHKEASWPGKIETIKPVFARMVAELSRSETVHVNVNDDKMEAEARRLLAEHGPLGEVVFHRLPTNDAWCRDHGAIFVKRANGSGATASLSGSASDVEVTAGQASSGTVPNPRCASIGSTTPGAINIRPTIWTTACPRAWPRF